MTKLVAVLAAAAALAVPTAPAHAAAPARPAGSALAAPWEEVGVYAVPANGIGISTLLPTQPGARYSIIVDGVAAYGDTVGLLDCGYWSDRLGSNLATTWYTASGNFFINGSRQSCGAYNPLHHYSMQRIGDGTFWDFVVSENNGFDFDNVGALTVTVIRQ